jgi:hypothetical protein
MVAVVAKEGIQESQEHKLAVQNIGIKVTHTDDEGLKQEEEEKMK